MYGAGSRHAPVALYASFGFQARGLLPNPTSRSALLPRVYRVEPRRLIMRCSEPGHGAWLQSTLPMGRVVELGSFGKTMKLVYFVAIALLAMGPAFAADTYYHLFPKGTLSHFEHRWYATHLSAMKEPVLALPAGDKDYFAFRILYSPTWGRPIALRIERKGGTTERRAMMLSGDGGYDLGEIKEEKRADIAKSEFVALLEDIPKERFLGVVPGR